MKKIYVITAALIVAISVVLGMTAQTVTNDLFEANIEVLAQSESGGKKCYKEFRKDPNDSEIYCQTCETLPGRPCKKSNCYNY